MILYEALAGDSDGPLSRGVFSTPEKAQEYVTSERSKYRWYTWDSVNAIKVDEPEWSED